ncbi:hypothetical protein T492DRAFT_881461 [Pavlovales sp. CCMP2436]|nr:hypothetical protein T492DRAFT_881461 [Pavlovales sp. CCMP2436]
MPPPGSRQPQTCWPDRADQASAAAALAKQVEANDATRTLILGAGALPLLMALLRAGTEDGKASAAGAILWLARDSPTRTLILSAGTLPPLVALLCDGTEQCKSGAAFAIAHLTKDAPIRTLLLEVPTLLGEASILPQLVALLRAGTEQGKENSAFAIATLAYGPPARTLLLGEGALSLLVALLRASTEHGKENAADAIGWFAKDPPTRTLIVEASVVPLLVALLRSGTVQSKVSAACAITWLANNAPTRALIMQAGALPPLVALLHVDNERGKAGAAVAISWLAHDPPTRKLIVKAGALPPLIALVSPSRACSGAFTEEHGAAGALAAAVHAPGCGWAEAARNTLHALCPTQGDAERALGDTHLENCNLRAKCDAFSECFASLASLAGLVEQGHDVVFRCKDGEEIGGSRLLLAHASPYYERLFQLHVMGQAPLPASLDVWVELLCLAAKVRGAPSAGPDAAARVFERCERAVRDSLCADNCLAFVDATHAVVAENVAAVLKQPEWLQFARQYSDSAASVITELAGVIAQLDPQLPSLLENPTLNSLFQYLSATTIIEENVLHDFIAGLATFGLAGGGVAADPESAARFQRELLELLKEGNPTRVEHDAYVSFWMNCLRKNVHLTSWPIILLHALSPTRELAPYVKRHTSGKYETCATGLINQHAACNVLVNGPMEALGSGAARKILAVIMDFLPGDDAEGALKKGDGSQHCYTPPSAVLSRILADKSMTVLTHAVDAGFVVFCIEGKYETELLLQRVPWKSRLDACSISAAFAHPHDADPFGNGVYGLNVVRFRHDSPLALLVSSPSSGACIFGPYRSIDEKALALNNILTRTNFLRELSGLAALPDNKSALVAYSGGRNETLLQRALSMDVVDVVRAAEVQSWRHARTLALPQCQGEEDPGRVAFLKSLPQRAPAGSARRLDWEKSLPQLQRAGSELRLDWEEATPTTAPAGSVAMLRCPHELHLDWEEATPATAPAGSVAMRCPQRAPAGSVLRLDWEDRQDAGAKKSDHAMAVADLSKRQRIDSDQAKRIVDAHPRYPCCEQTMKEDEHLNMRVSAELRLTTSTKFKMHLKKVTRIYEIQRK